MSNPAAVEADTILQPLRVSRPARGLVGHIRVPGDSALGQRAMAIAALAVGATEITHLAETAPTRALAVALRQLGARVEQPAPGHWRIHGRGVGGLAEPAGVLEAGASPLVLHLLAGLLAGLPSYGVVAGTGAPSAAARDVLGRIGARITTRAGGQPPWTIEGAAEPLPLDLDFPADPAGVAGTAALLAALGARGTSRLGGVAADGMAGLLRRFGAGIDEDEAPDDAGLPHRSLRLHGQPELTGAALALPPGTLNGAGLLLGAILCPGSALVLDGLGPDAPLAAMLREMGASLELTGADLTVRHATLRGIDIPAARLRAAGPAGPLLAVAAACARGACRLQGAGSIWGQGRMDATLRLLATQGADARQDGQDLLLTGDGRPPRGGGRLATLEEPCIAMSAIVLGLACEAPTILENPQGIDPAFLAALAQLAGPGAAAPDLPGTVRA
ncbi:3-phosphoshikimate 1-carboxyvinyltransferase [Roseomonas aerophila]|uniref:3-phosphoshikimate 1-carboxyvinyltransferase n=1 Tax=Teichococcus aerophilus TaxID=1224513 RepID=A0ABR7RUA7_9PROT|nr:3-phosphoshikimate 1-carboxyvinyltransferase [Pseudoroseomonas aerophila]MBC9209958.1 3-phosphoshikimate 1-carboxyvinyltransferase [Pseudoroseomonas aerophila]